jgi:hypothetical protein
VLPSILQGVTVDRSGADDSTLVLLGLLSLGGTFRAFLERAAPPVAPVESAPSPEEPDAPLALALGILAFHRHLTERLDRTLPEVSTAPSRPIDRVAPGPLPRGLLR